MSELPRYGPAIRTKVVACVQMGRIAEAQESLARMTELQPGLTIAKFRAYAARNFPPELLAIYIDGLRKAGFAGRMTQSRRLAAILAADVAGYSRLMGADEVGTLAALKAIRREVADPKIKEHRGRIVKTTVQSLRDGNRRAAAKPRRWRCPTIPRSRCCRSRT